MFRDFKTQSSIGYAFDDDPLNTKTRTSNIAPTFL